MPLVFIFFHLGLASTMALAVLRVRERSHLSWVIPAGVLVVMGLGLAIERARGWSWFGMNTGWPGVVFVTNLSLEAVVVLLAALWRKAADRASRVRAAVLTPLALFAALWSYRWYFAPVPPGLHGQVDAQGHCAQTSDYSCSAAAAVMLLQARGIPVTEAGMARLCLTREGFGTTDLGLFHGLAIYAAPHHLRPRMVRLAGVAALSRATPCIISVGLLSDAPAAIAARMERYGWEPGQRHSVFIRAADPGGRWLDVDDPSYGRERWPSADIEYIWDGQAIVLTRLSA